MLPTLPGIKKNYFTAAFRALPGVNLTTFLAGILISLPVWGFRPTRAFLLPTLKVPKPTKVTAWPFLNPFFIASNTQETALSANLLLPTTLPTSTTKSALFNLPHPLCADIEPNFPLF